MKKILMIFSKSANQIQIFGLIVTTLLKYNINQTKIQYENIKSGRIIVCIIVYLGFNDEICVVCV